RPVYRLLVPWLGFPSGEVAYRREKRAAGGGKYRLSTMLRLAWDSVTTFSPAPLRLATGLGAVTFALCVVAVVLAMVSYATGHTVSGWASLIIAVLFLGAVQLRSEERRVGKEGRAGRSTPRDEDRIHNTH